jgi:putative transposase
MPRMTSAISPYHVHYTQTYASWLNQVDIWFGIITQRAIWRGVFHSVRQLIQKIEDFVEHHDLQSRPFVWVATADSILQKINRRCSLMSGT